MDLQHAVITEVVNAVTVYSPKGRLQLMENRRYYGLSLCTSGQITYTQHGKRYVSDRTHAVILPLGASYTIAGDKTGDFPVINFLCRDFLCDTIEVIEVKNPEQLLHLYEQLRGHLLLRGSHAKAMSLLYEMIDALATEECPYRLLPAMRYLETHYQEAELSNEDLAWECRISEVYFRRLFTEAFGVTPKQYVIRLRLQKAQQLLEEGAWSVQEISERCGFSGPYHFCRQFKEHLGLTPMEYRRANSVTNA